MDLFEFETELDRRVRAYLLLDVIGKPNTPKRLDDIREDVQAMLDKAAQLNEIPAGLVTFYVGPGDEDENTELILNFGRNYKIQPMTLGEFHDWFAREQDLDELKRINCRNAGETGHSSCGWCVRHRTAFWDCGCLNRIE